MSSNIVAHPKTGLAVRKQVNFVEVEREQLEEALAKAEASAEQTVAAKRAAFEETLNQDPEVQAARSAVEDCKSDIETFDVIESEQSEEADDGPVEPSSEGEDEAEEGEDSVPGVDESESKPKKPRKLEVTEETDEVASPAQEPAAEEEEIDPLDRDY